jgi:hypothetical protein
MQTLSPFWMQRVGEPTPWTFMVARCEVFPAMVADEWIAPGKRDTGRFSGIWTVRSMQ